jgi:hypothetical protein
MVEKKHPFWLRFLRACGWALVVSGLLAAITAVLEAVKHPAAPSLVVALENAGRLLGGFVGTVGISLLLMWWLLHTRKAGGSHGK